ncbi:hypothetical protein ABT56_19155 [Photobacterium aquae]|uniref:Uncharacterized protein n=1 Tax=Photobacterium aquae TaxID=1195763 RepID=A0A0J1JN01_9GAMM|nr:hypothetical protein ABT56_19155 [Photobacterium aquae]
MLEIYLMTITKIALLQKKAHEYVISILDGNPLIVQSRVESMLYEYLYDHHVDFRQCDQILKRISRLTVNLALCQQKKGLIKKGA